MEQTAVDRLIEILKDYNYFNEKTNQYFETAKQMEKQQISEAYENGYSDGFDDAQTINPICKIEFNTSGEQYYDDTFEK